MRAIGNNVTGVQGDAGDLADLDRLYETVKAEKGTSTYSMPIPATANSTSLSARLQKRADKTFNSMGHALHCAERVATIERRWIDHPCDSIASVKGFQGLASIASKAALRSFARTWTMIGRREIASMFSVQGRLTRACSLVSARGQGSVCGSHTDGAHWRASGDCYCGTLSGIQ